jgi:hypothetical protein
LLYGSGLFCLFLLTGFAARAQQQDTTQTAATTTSPKIQMGHQLRAGIDISKPVIHALQSNYTSYELSVDYNLYSNLYWVAEGGWGNVYRKEKNKCMVTDWAYGVLWKQQLHVFLIGIV